MKTAIEILRTVERAGGRLECAGYKLRMLLPADCSPALKAAIRQHKGELLALLENRQPICSNEELAWSHIIKQILAGEFEELTDKSIFDALSDGLRNAPHPLCRLALRKLTSQWNETLEGS